MSLPFWLQFVSGDISKVQTCLILWMLSRPRKKKNVFHCLFPSSLFSIFLCFLLLLRCEKRSFPGGHIYQWSGSRLPMTQWPFCPLSVGGVFIYHPGPRNASNKTPKTRKEFFPCMETCLKCFKLRFCIILWSCYFHHFCA